MSNSSLVLESFSSIKEDFFKNSSTKIAQNHVKIQKFLVVGNRIPKNFFLTSGTGESDITIHAGSYHIALKNAGIERCNIITYSSILPAIATEVSKPIEGELVHGSVMETIMACANSKHGEKATAGLITGWLHDKKTNEKYGGLVCEYHGNCNEEEAAMKLHASLNELHTNGFSEKFNLSEIRATTKSIVPTKKFGTSLVALCFVDYNYPILGIMA